MREGGRICGTLRYKYFVQKQLLPSIVKQISFLIGFSFETVVAAIAESVMLLACTRLFNFQP